MTIEVVLESEVTDVERAAVAEAFESAGIQADVQGAYVRRSTDLLPWIIEIIVTGVGARFMWAAAAGAGDEAGRDAWKRLKKLITDLYEARQASRAPQGGVSLRDSGSEVEIQLPPDLPDAAYRRLCEIENLTAPLSGILRWDNDLQDWTDVLRANTAVSTQVVRHLLPRAVYASLAQQSCLAACSVTCTPPPAMLAT
jgi:hypothetical protein